MATMVNLFELLEHEVEDLYSAEEQLIEALPLMAEGATNRELKRTITEHLRITKAQKKRLDAVRKALKSEMGVNGEQRSGFLDRIFGGGTKCKGMEGLITEGNKILSEDMEPEVKDAAIIAASQKIEHYEISGYGTARAYARQLGLREVERLLNETLKEEGMADKLLNTLALRKINIQAERGGAAARGGRSGTSAKKSGAKKSGAKKSAGKKAGSKR